jgi:hypothetical protein
MITNSLGSSSAALAIAFHDRCDLVVATVVFGDGRTSDLDVAVMQFLNSDLVRHWLERTLGL